jgi:DNA-directed RNA polymerase subunit P
MLTPAFSAPLGDNVEIRPPTQSETMSEAEKPAEQVKVFPGAVYECVRCGTRTTQEELSALPEVKCICGYRVFRKVRPSVVKQIKAV